VKRKSEGKWLNIKDSVESVEPMSDVPDWREWAQETIQTYKGRHIGSVVGERLHHRAWPPDVILAFLGAEVIKPKPGSLR